MSTLFLELCDDILYIVGDYLRPAQEAKEREFQCSLVADRRKTFFLDYDDDDYDRDENSPRHQATEFHLKSLRSTILSESHLLYHPECDLEKEIIKRYKMWIPSPNWWLGTLSELDRFEIWLEENYMMLDMELVCREHDPHATAGKLSSTSEQIAYKRVRNGCHVCTEDSLLCDYCCRQGSMKNRMKWGFLKYSKQKGRKYITEDNPIPHFNSYVKTHKNRPGMKPKRRR